jgi:hypothetical protein
MMLVAASAAYAAGQRFSLKNPFPLHISHFFRPPQVQAKRWIALFRFRLHPYSLLSLLVHRPQS